MRAASRTAAMRAAWRRRSSSGSWRRRRLRAEVGARAPVARKRRGRELHDATGLAVHGDLRARCRRFAVLLAQLVARRPGDEEEVAHGGDRTGDSATWLLRNRL